MIRNKCINMPAVNGQACLLLLGRYIKIMLEFKEIKLDSLNEITDYLEYRKTAACDYTPLVLYMWSDRHNYKYCISGGMLFIKAYYCGARSFYFPIGTGNINEAFDGIDAYCAKENCKTIVFAFTDEQRVFLEERYKDATSDEIRGDYVYPADDLKELPGKKYHNKKNHINKFKRLYPDYTFRRLEIGDITRVRAFLDIFYLVRNKVQPSFGEERTCIEKVLDNYAALPFLLGAILEANGEIVGFSIGEIYGGILYVHIEKAFTDTEGAYSVLNNEFAKMYAAGGIEYIDREDDAGDPGLMQAKMSYHPCEILKSYAFNINDL